MRYLFVPLGLALAGVFMSGCFSSIFGIKYYYRAEVGNAGKATVYVPPFILYDPNKGGYSEGPSGYLGCNIHNGSGHYYHLPYKTVNIKWKNQDTGEGFQAIVNIDLPKNFTEETGNRLVFNINPEEKKVYMTYVLYKPNNSPDTYEIDDDGKPVKRPRYRGK